MSQIESASPSARCPFHAATDPEIARAVADFDVFEGPFTVDPAAAMRLFRERRPIFFSPKLGYWVVSRYEDVKDVFRDTGAFSPANALEKVTPSSAEANAILASHDYAMNRTLVNEDEPAHMERRRALLHSFLPAELEKHAPMVRRLVARFVDRFVDRGEADLVDELLWEVPLTVALHFLGVPEDDMDVLRRYSIAHTVNTWGRPSPDQQVAVAEAVGNFWTYSGQVLDRMRLDPSGDGWMEYALRRQRELPDVVTDSYLHSMMMAGIVAAHETTAHATANALRLLLEDRKAWDEVCRDGALIPNAVEECLRLSGSIIAWRRVALKDVEIAGQPIAAGDRILVVMTSANHDGRHFENPDMLDIRRDNTTDHLSFGYGAHQCLGKNLARMEMRILLEELSRRLPHMRLAEQRFDYLPTISFRGPDHLRVVWDPARNPERADDRAKTPRPLQLLGSPPRSSLARPVRVAAIDALTDDVVQIALADPEGHDLPPWSAGAHVDLLVGGFQRKYSLCGDPGDRKRYVVAVKRDAAGRGGSLHIHAELRVGDTIGILGPKNLFRLPDGSERIILVAGGIGITPIIAMADRLKSQGRRYEVHYCGRTRAAMAYADRLERDHGAAAHVHVGEEGRRLDLAALVGAGREAIVACGPDRMIDALQALCADAPDRLRFEHFAAVETLLDPSVEAPFEAELRDSGLTLTVPADRTLLQVLREAGIDLPSDCEEGLCGSCEVGVVDGEVDHRDMVLTAKERAENKRMMACCSRSRNGRIGLSL